MLSGQNPQQQDPNTPNFGILAPISPNNQQQKQQGQAQNPENGKIVAQGQMPSSGGGDAIGGLLSGLKSFIGGAGSSLGMGNTQQGSPGVAAATNALSGVVQPNQSRLSQVVNNSGIFNNALGELGLKGGDPTLTSFLAKANPNLDPSATPWCAGFVGSVLNASGLKGTGSLAAKSYLNYGAPTKTPTQGDIVVFNDLTGQNRPEHGHVGFVDHIDQNTGQVFVLGGNQNNSVSMKAYPLSMVAGFRQPPSGQQVKQFAAQNGIQNPQQLASLTKQGNNNMSDSNNNNPLSIPNVVKSAQNVYKDNPTMAAVAASQAILESRLNGKPSGLAKDNNLFGIKGQGTDGTVNMGTKEYDSGGAYSTQAGFAKNKTLDDSFKQHADLMQHDRYAGVRNAKDVNSAFDALQKSGYATDPNYAKQLKAVYQQYVAPNMSSKQSMNTQKEIPVTASPQQPTPQEHKTWEDMMREIDQGRDDYSQNNVPNSLGVGNMGNATSNMPIVDPLKDPRVVPDGIGIYDNSGYNNNPNSQTV